METIILIVVISLLVLAVIDIVVGVSNDAINFLNSALGSKAFNYKTIMIIASLGIFIGAVFSSGMMEVARKGIFHPQMFSFYDIMVIFVAVLIGDILLLNIFNSLGMPTSTTVSIVFNLLGAAIAVGFIKVLGENRPFSDLALFINSSTALWIIFGILLSVVVAFTLGAISQYISRIVFTFQYNTKTRPFSMAIFGGITIAAITYFIVLKGLKGTDFYGEIKVFLKEYTLIIIAGSFLFWSIVSYISIKFLKVNILKFIILLGTFSLALAFAGNDLVNFIGVPIAGFNSWEFWKEAGSIDPHLYYMEALGKKVPTPAFFLFTAGAIMIITLWTSKKAKNVAKTTLDLSAQGDKDEKFSSNTFSRAIVKGSIHFNNAVQAIIPNKTRDWIDTRFQMPEKSKKDMKDVPEFDLIRASVNLLIAAILISIGTSFKLPLSTTYITFMVAMGASLSDRAWGRESAVYRIAGVVSVIGGWFLTALSALLIAASFAALIHYTGFVTALILEVGVIFLLFRNRSKKVLSEEDIETEEEEKEAAEENEITEAELIEKADKQIKRVLKRSGKYLKKAFANVSDNKSKFAKPLIKEVDNLREYTKKRKTRTNKVLLNLVSDAEEAGIFYVQMIEAQREIAMSVFFTVQPIAEHFINSHRPLLLEQKDELENIYNSMDIFSSNIMKAMDKKDFKQRDSLNAEMENIIKLINNSRRKQVKRVKADVVNVRNSLLYFNILEELKNISMHIMSLFKAYRDFLDVTED
ncbi:MAG: inorganic phosphate transporter [Bacteroidales bacterium]|nr:inorganic phosphate transporter [Bacteroidales bacterium]